MLNENAKKWVAALRSGEYKQACGRLRVDDGYCCLGVAYKLATGEEPSTGNWDEAHPLYEIARAWLGLEKPLGDYDYEDCTCSLAQKNDNGSTFADIAAVIESEPEGLFLPEVKI